MLRGSAGGPRHDIAARGRKGAGYQYTALVS